MGEALSKKSKCLEVVNVVTKEAGNNFPILKPWRQAKTKRLKKKNGEGPAEKKYQTLNQKAKIVRKIVQMKRPMVLHSKGNLLSRNQSQNQKMKDVNLKVPRV